MRVRIDVRIEANGPDEGYGSLQLGETFDLGALESFAEIAAVLGAFHDVAERVKGDRAKS